MSLDVYLISEIPVLKEKGTGIFVRKNGQTKELSYEEAVKDFPDSVIEIPEGEYKTDELFHTNITHNLGIMADKANLYKALWRPYQLLDEWNDDYENNYDEECEFEQNHTIYAGQLIPELSKGLINLLSSPEEYKKYNPENGWGTYEQLCDFTYNYLKACNKYPTAIVNTDR